MIADNLISAKEFYTILGVPQPLFNVWCQRRFVVPAKAEGGRRKKLFFSFDELMWGLIFVLFVQQLGVDREKTTNAWRGRVLEAVAKEKDLIALSFGRDLQVVGKNIRGPYLQMMKMKRDSFQGVDPRDVLRMVQDSPGTVCVNLKTVREYLLAVIENEH